MKLDVLKDGTPVTVRPPTMADLERARRFFLSLPEEDRQFLRYDVTRKEVVGRLISEVEAGRALRVDAYVGDDEIVAHGALELLGEGLQRHIGELRVLVSKSHRGKRLGTIVMGHLFREARRMGLEKVIAKMAAPQVSARTILERLGFHIDAVLPDHAKLADGKLYPVVVMSCGLDHVSDTLREFYKDENWPDG